MLVTKKNKYKSRASRRRKRQKKTNKQNNWLVSAVNNERAHKHAREYATHTPLNKTHNGRGKNPPDKKTKTKQNKTTSRRTRKVDGP